MEIFGFSDLSSRFGVTGGVLGTVDVFVERRLGFLGLRKPSLRKMLNDIDVLKAYWMTKLTIHLMILLVDQI